jgi:O-antigen/teichoic acid export membrane protein
MLRNIVHLGLGQVVTTLLAILLSAAIARTLGAAEFGLLYLVTTVGTFAYVFVDWGHGAYITREIARHPDRAGELTGTVMAARAATALFLCGPVVATTWLLGYDRVAVVLSATRMVSWIPGYVAMSYSWAFRGVERMDYDALINVTMKLSTLIFSLAVLALGGRVLSLILLSILNGLVTLVVGARLYRRLRLPALRVTSTAAYELLRGGAPMLAMGITIAAQPYVNANVLHAYAPREVLGWYGVTWGIGGTLLAPATILGAGMYPRFSNAASDPGELRRVLAATFRPLIFIAILGAVGTYLFAGAAIGAVYGAQKYAQAADILKAFAPGLLLLYVDTFFGSALLAVGKALHLAAAKLAAVAVATAVGIVLTSYFQSHYRNGGIGIMLALAAGELVMVLAVMVLLRTTVNRGMFVDLCRGLLAGGLTMGIVLWMPALTPFVKIPACVLLFCGLAAALGLVNRTDIESVKATFSARGKGATEARTGAALVMPEGPAVGVPPDGL